MDSIIIEPAEILNRRAGRDRLRNKILPQRAGETASDWEKPI